MFFVSQPIAHTYYDLMKALISDLLDYKLNRVTIDIPEKDGNELPPCTCLVDSQYVCMCCGIVGSQGKKKTYDLNTHADHFLNRYASSPFPEAIEANEKELAEV